MDFGPLVKRLRHRPFTAVTRVRIPYGSFKLWRISSAGRASALQAEGRRFDPVILHSCIGSVAQSVEQRTENPCVGGSIPSRATLFLCGCSLVVKLQPSKLMLWVRFPSPALIAFEYLI